MKKLLFLLTLISLIAFTSCRAQDLLLDYNEFKTMINKKEVDKVTFYKDSSMVSIENEGKITHYEHTLDVFEGKKITRELSKAGIIYKTKATFSD